VVSVSAQTRQRTLDGHVARQQPPTDARPATLEHLPSDVALPTSVPWIALAESEGTERVLRWIDRAAAEGVIETSGGER
jgi:hypothetical protein